ncbi:MAG: hypothetical protein ACYC6W_09675 [Nitrosotalea sp.]
MSDDHTYISSGSVKVEKTPRDKCRLCGKDAGLKVGIWEINPQSETDRNAWRMLFLCGECNDKEKFIDFEKVWDEIGF